jgi:hypothetical protein
MSAPVPIEANLNTTQVSDTFIPAEKLFDKTNQSSLDNSFNMNLIGCFSACRKLSRRSAGCILSEVAISVTPKAGSNGPARHPRLPHRLARSSTPGPGTYGAERAPLGR